MTCLLWFDSTTMCDYWHVPQIMVCTAGFLMFQMPVLIGTDSFFVSTCKSFWDSQGIYLSEKCMATLDSAKRHVWGSAVVCEGGLTISSLSRLPPTMQMMQSHTAWLILRWIFGTADAKDCFYQSALRN
jgi:hypothetical protein